MQLSAAQEEDARRDHSRAMAQRRAVLGGSGVDFATGSPLLVGQDLEGDAELQALRIRSGGEARSTSLRQDALLTRAKGTAARTASFFTAGSKLASATEITFKAIEKRKPNTTP